MQVANAPCSWGVIENIEGERYDYARVLDEIAASGYAGTELGVHVSFDDGENWQPIQANLPINPVYDIKVKGNDLIAGTHGRSIWILDDLNVVRQLAESAGSDRPRLFADIGILFFQGFVEQVDNFFWIIIGSMVCHHDNIDIRTIGLPVFCARTNCCISFIGP